MRRRKFLWRKSLLSWKQFQNFARNLSCADKVLWRGKLFTICEFDWTKKSSKEFHNLWVGCEESFDFVRRKFCVRGQNILRGNYSVVERSFFQTIPTKFTTEKFRQFTNIFQISRRKFLIPRQSFGRRKCERFCRFGEKYFNSPPEVYDDNSESLNSPTTTWEYFFVTKVRAEKKFVARKFLKVSDSTRRRKFSSEKKLKGFSLQFWFNFFFALR